MGDPPVDASCVFPLPIVAEVGRIARQPRHLTGPSDCRDFGKVVVYPFSHFGIVQDRCVPLFALRNSNTELIYKVELADSAQRI